MAGTHLVIPVMHSAPPLAMSDVTRRALENPYWALTLVIFVGSMINGTFTLIVLALPVLGDEFRVDESIIVWVRCSDEFGCAESMPQPADEAPFGQVLFAPLLTAGILSVPLGRASDLYGRKRMWFLGTCFHLVSMVVCGLAPSIELLLAARVFTGDSC